ncbi:MAG: hypothetical protein EOP85_15900 [Verrucomicrobiaceae bacterium]|nr:MAG: hypothetical protein EOP85_15900 [Verrucomicrobiaceae bacterium]
MRTEEEITAEITELEAIKPKVRHRSAFGDNHRDAVDAQVTVLKDKMDEGAIWDRHENAMDDEEFYAENERDSALEAARWLHGETDEKPSAGWEDLLE